MAESFKAGLIDISTINIIHVDSLVMVISPSKRHNCLSVMVMPSMSWILANASRLPRKKKLFVAVCRGEREPVTEAERVWSKYMTRIKRPKRFHTLSGGKPQVEGAEDYTDSDD